MALWQGHLTHAEREVVAGAPLSTVYFMLDPGGSGRYVLGQGSKASEAAAFLKADPIASALGRYTLDSDRLEEDRTPYTRDGVRVIV